jgi:hypothetical protein
MENINYFNVKNVYLDKNIYLSDLAYNNFSINNDGEINCLLPLLDDDNYKDCAKNSLF